METKTKPYYENNIDDIAVSKEEFLVKDYNKTRAKSFLHKLGNSLGLVVVVLPVAGLFAAIGGIIMSKGQNEATFTVGLIFSDLGQTVLGNLGLLFMLAIVIGFTGNKGMAVYAAIIGYIAFVGFTVAFIRYDPIMVQQMDWKLDPKSGLWNLVPNGTYAPGNASDAKYFHLWFWQNIGGKGHGLDATTQLANVFGFGQAGNNNPIGQLVRPDTTDAAGNTIPGNIWVWQGTSGVKPFKLSGSVGEFAHASFQGVRTLNTGVLGGIALGFVYVWIYNKFKDLHLPAMLAFFEGEKFVAILMILLAPVVASLFIIVWPAVNYALGYIGIGFSYIPFGFDSFFYGMFTRFLLPFEAHPAFYGPLWWTSAGGQLSGSQADIMASMINRLGYGATVGIGKETDISGTYINGVKIAFEKILSGDKSTNLWAWIQATFNGQTFDGSNTAAAFTKLFANSIPNAADIAKGIEQYAGVDWTISGDQLISIALLNKYSWFDMRDVWGAGLKATRFIAGGFSDCMFVIPAIGLAMFATLDKKRRGPKFGLYFGAILSSFLLGVTEPIEFMFAFTAPLIFFGFYAPFYGLVFLFNGLFQVKLGSTFSNGLMDYIVNGIIPSLTRQGVDGATDVSLGVQQTGLWKPIVIGVIGAGIAFPLFKLIFTKFNFAAPGSLAAETGEGVSQSKYSEVKEDYDGLKDYVGGPENVLEVTRIKPTMMKIKVKYNKYVINNDFADNKLDDVVKSGSEYTIVAKDQHLGPRYLNILNLMVTMRLKNEAFKDAVEQEKRDFKDYLTGKYTIAEYKAAMKQRIKDFDENDKKKRQALNVANRKALASLTAKRNDKDIKPQLDAQRAKMDSQVKALDDAQKAFLASEKAKELAFIKKVKDSKKSINKADAKKLRKAQIKNFMVNKKRAEAINKVQAEWQFKQDKLMTTTDLEQLKYNFFINSWNEKHLEEKQLLKTEYKFNKMLTNNKEIRKQIKQDYETMAQGLAYDKTEQAKKEEDYKQKVIAMKAQNKIEFKKQSKQ